MRKGFIQIAAACWSWVAAVTALIVRVRTGVRYGLASALGMMVFSGLANVALAAGGNLSASGPVCYGAPLSGVSTVQTALQEVAGSIRDILGVTALVALVVAALVNHFVHDPRSKDRAREIVWAAVIGLAVAVFAPTLIGFVMGLGGGNNC